MKFLNTENKLKLNFGILLISFMVLIIIVFLIPFNIYKTFKGYVFIDKDVYINLLLDQSDFPINKNNKLYIKTKQYNYEVSSFYEYGVYLKVNLDEEISIDGNMVLVNIKEEKTNILKILIKELKKGFGL